MGNEILGALIEHPVGSALQSSPRYHVQHVPHIANEAILHHRDINPLLSVGIILEVLQTLG
jgi:hypothetical protein